MRIAHASTALSLLCLLLFAACRDGGQPGSLSIAATQFGSPTRASAELWDSAGKKMLQEVHSDARGQLKFNSVPPGRYLLRFNDPGGRSFAAQRMVTIGSAEAVSMEVEVTERGEGSDPHTEPAGEAGEGSSGQAADGTGTGRGSGR